MAIKIVGKEIEITNVEKNTKLETKKSDKPDEILDLIEKNTILKAATKGNNPLLLALVEAARAMAGVEKLSAKMVDSLIKSSTSLTKAAKAKGFREAFIVFLEAVIKEKLAGTRVQTPSTGSSPTDDPDEEEPVEAVIEVPDSDVNLQIMALLDDIPIAHYGDIITSEHHNSLRRAIRAIASLIDDTALTSVNTFPPIFLPMEFPVSQTMLSQNWKILFDKAVTPSINELGGPDKIVKGAFFVRLPDDVFIDSMIVRGKRLNEEFHDPKSFNVRLYRFEPDKINNPATALIDLDLKEENSVFKRKASPPSNLQNQRIDNVKYQYYVSAVWEDLHESSGFEIRSVQIICEH